MVGLGTIRLLVQVHRHWVQFTLARRGYDNHNCPNKPQIGNEAGVWMTSCPEAMGWEFGYFKKYVSWVLDCRRVELVVYWGPVSWVLLWPVQLGVDFGHIESWSWVKTMVLRSWSLTMEFCRSLPTKILKTTRCAERLSFVSIEWLRIVSLSPRVEEPNSEVNKLINVCTWTTESPVHVCPPVFLHTYNVCDGYDYTTSVLNEPWGVDMPLDN